MARLLQTAMDEGRLTPVELQERLDTLYRSKTLRELEPLTWDLPGHHDLVPRPPAAPVALSKAASGAAPDRIGGTPTSSVAIGIMSGATRAGNWVVPAQFSAVAIMGGVDIDLTKARFAERQVTITALAIMGGIDIVVPDGRHRRRQRRRVHGGLRGQRTDAGTGPTDRWSRSTGWP